MEKNGNSINRTGFYFVIFTLSVLLPLSILESSFAESKFREYTLDSLRVYDKLQMTSEIVVRLLGHPRSPAKFSLLPDCYEYTDSQIKLYERELWSLENPYGEALEKLESFLEKYKQRGEAKLVSYGDIRLLRLALKSTIQCLQSVKNERRFMRDEWFTVKDCGTMGFNLGQLICGCEILGLIEKHGVWLSTDEELQKKHDEAKKNVERLEEERARILEERSK